MPVVLRPFLRFTLGVVIAGFGLFLDLMLKFYGILGERLFTTDLGLSSLKTD
jgi:hypothetical protein